MERKCGDCQACCKALPLTTIGKLPGQRCQHQRHGKGCAIFGQFGRPVSCAVWRCQWLADPTFDSGRPDRVGYFIDPTPDVATVGPDAITGRRVTALRVWVDPSRPDAYRDPKLRAWIAGVASGRELVAVVYGLDRYITLVPPEHSETGDWMELESAAMKPATVGEIRKAMIEEMLGARAGENVSRETTEGTNEPT